ncbi:hypothetical protein ACQUD0_04510 [Vagococcus fluvialis]|uniref:hypothetical protein n=1 Tax=Vagococcus fluvialis TaxID=2738 RepID=UPI001F119373|nr:hypothetical protein [Vagococcus fluvialis]
MKKKTFYKKWWFILIIVVLTVGSIGSLYGISAKEKARAKEDAITEAKAKKEEIEKLKKEEALAEKKKKQEQEKLEKLALEKEEQTRIAQEETIEQQPTITEESVDPRTTDPRSEYYQATPEEIEQGRLMEQQAQDDFWANQNSNNDEISTDETTLSGFINKYGMSPAMYKIQYEGMSEEEALKSTPDSMKTSGEIQLGHSNYGI